MSRVPAGWLRGWHDTHWNRRWWKEVAFRLGHPKREEPIEQAWRTAGQVVEDARPKPDSDCRCEEQQIPVGDKKALEFRYTTQLPSSFCRISSLGMICVFSKENWHDPMLMRLDQAIPSLLQEISTQITNEMKLLCCITWSSREQYWLGGDVLLPKLDGWMYSVCCMN